MKSGVVCFQPGVCWCSIPSSWQLHHQYYSNGLTFWSVDWVCHPRGWVQIKTGRNQHVLKDVERITRASTARWLFQVVMCIGGILVLWWFIVTLEVCLRCDDSLWSWHALGFNVVSAYIFFRAIKAGWMLKAQPGPVPFCVQNCFWTKWQMIITFNGTELNRPAFWLACGCLKILSFSVDELTLSWNMYKILRGMPKEFTVWNGTF